MRQAHFLAIAVVSLTLTLLARAQEAPKPQYRLKEDESSTGTHIRRDRLTGSSIALNRPYARLSQADKEALHSWWENMPSGDEPPFPAQGLGALYAPLGKVHDAQLEPGTLFAVATVGTNGEVVEAKVFEAPNAKMAQAAARLLLLTEFKPAVCAGQPCRMDFPLRMTFTVTR